MNTFSKLALSLTKSSPSARSPIDEQYRYWRMRIFCSIYVGYVAFYLTRKSFTFAMPSLMDDLGYSKADLGFLASVLYISYGISKFASGILADRVSPRYLMSIGLILTGVMNIFFAWSSSLALFAVFWGLNGFFQGWGLSPATKQLTYWFSKSERGFWWSVFGTSNNLGGALSPLLVAFVITSLLDWRMAMHVPGIISIGMGLILMASLRDIPSSLGLPDVEVYRGEAPASSEAKTATPAASIWSIFSIRAIWILALAFFVIYVIRSGVNDWVALYLSRVKGYSLTEATGSVSWFEVGGFAGCLACGWISDHWFRGKRVPYIVLCALGLLVSLGLFWSMPGADMWLDNCLLAASGFFIFGPQALIGLASAEIVDKELACTAHGFTGLTAYLGAAASGYPLGMIIDAWGWQGFFVAMLVCCVILCAVLLPLLSSSTPAVKDSEAKPQLNSNKVMDCSAV